MASGNAYRALDAWPDLPAVPRLVLVTMALVARDNPTDEYDAAHYFGGAEFLQQKVWGRVDASAARQLEKAITTLVRQGALIRRVKGAPGRRAEYDLVLDRPKHPTETVVEHPTKKEQTPDRNGRSHPTETVGPRGTREIEKKEEMDNAALVTTSPAPVDNSANPEIDEMDTGQRNQLLIARHGVRVHTVLAEHAAQHPDCDDPVRHLLATPTPTLRVIPGGAA